MSLDELEDDDDDDEDELVELAAAAVVAEGVYPAFEVPAELSLPDEDPV